MLYLFIYLLQRQICFLLSHYMVMRSHNKVRLENKFMCVQLHIRKQKHVLTETEINANVANKKANSFRTAYTSAKERFKTPVMKLLNETHAPLKSLVIVDITGNENGVMILDLVELKERTSALRNYWWGFSFDRPKSL